MLGFPGGFLEKVFLDHRFYIGGNQGRTVRFPGFWFLGKTMSRS